jgi:hypothetical protein
MAVRPTVSSTRGFGSSERRSVKKMAEKDAEDLLRQETFELLVRFSDDVLETAAERLCSEEAYDMLRDLAYEEFAFVVRNVLIGHLGRLN